MYIYILFGLQQNIDFRSAVQNLLQTRVGTGAVGIMRAQIAVTLYREAAITSVHPLPPFGLYLLRNFVHSFSSK